jgi:1-acyl-sn-glycerol-3-phosphate acyltransferase
VSAYFRLARLYLSLVWAGLRALPGYLYLQRRHPERIRGFLVARSARWGRRAVALVGGRVSVTGVERVPETGPVLYVANHQGALDIPLLMGYLPGSPAFLAKRELFSIPFMAYWMRQLQCVGVDRTNARAALAQIEAAAENVRGGRRMVLFPEGTRSRDPDGRMGPFKRGSLKLAVQAGAVVVPVTVEGSRFLLAAERPPDFTGEVRLILGEPIAVAGLDEPARKALPETLYETIRETRERHCYGRAPVASAVP